MPFTNSARLLLMNRALYYKAKALVPLLQRNGRAGLSWPGELARVPDFREEICRRIHQRHLLGLDYEH
jgi:hypothetical protein